MSFRACNAAFMAVRLTQPALDADGRRNVLIRLARHAMFLVILQRRFTHQRRLPYWLMHSGIERTRGTLRWPRLLKSRNFWPARTKGQFLPVLPRNSGFTVSSGRATLE